MDRRQRFRDLHRAGLFVMPNPWDIGSARLLASMGFEALATTSSGHAASLGRPDQHVTRDELLAHVAALSAALDVPLNHDAERGFADDPAGVAETVGLIAEAGAAGCSIEDYDPAHGRIDPLEIAGDRVAAATGAARAQGMVLTARAENHLYGVDDLEDTIRRLRAYRDAGAEVLYAPGVVDSGDIRRVVEEVEAPINVLALRHGPSVPELAAIGQPTGRSSRPRASCKTRGRPHTWTPPFPARRLMPPSALGNPSAPRARSAHLVGEVGVEPTRRLRGTGS